jgi:hypothetical protein
MEITTRQILKILYIFSWIIFAGVSILAFGFIFSTIYTLIANPVTLKTFWDGADLSDLYKADRVYFFIIASLMSITSLIKAFMFYLIVKILHDKKLNLLQPFNKEIGSFIFQLSYLAFGIGILSGYALNHTKFLIERGIRIPDLEVMHLGGSDVWLFMAVILFIIAHIFKRGIEIQSENELTI